MKNNTRFAMSVCPHSIQHAKYTAKRLNFPLKIAGFHASSV